MATSSARGVATGVACAAFMLFPAAASAGLGRASTSIESDRAALRAQRTSIYRTGYTMHALALPNGGTVNEFERPDGMVFAVTWRAPGRPDLRQLLGEAFGAMQEDNAPAARRMRRPLRVNRSDVLLQSGGHPGAFWGAALLPKLEPAGFAPSDLQ